MKELAWVAMVAVCCLASSSQAYVTLYVDGDGYSSDFDDVPGAGPDWQKVAEVGLNDGNTSYVSSSDNGDRSLFTLQNLDLPAGATIDYVTVNAVMSFPSNNMHNGYFGVRTGGVEDWGSLVSVNSNTSYAAYSRTYATNPGSGLAWTDSDVDSLQAGFRIGDEDHSGMRATQVTVDVYYTLAADPDPDPDPELQPATVPAPMSILLAGFGSALVGWLRRRNAV